MVSHDLLPAKSGVFLDATYVPLYIQTLIWLATLKMKATVLLPSSTAMPAMLLSATTLVLGIGGLNGVDYDHVQVGGNASLSGNLIVSSLNGFHPVADNAFEVLHTNGRLTGNFTHLDDSAFKIPGRSGDRVTRFRFLTHFASYSLP
jgi:hypothetical protein